MSEKSFQPGDRVIYRKRKESLKPGPRAQNVHATPRGDQYVYTVDKFWRVLEVKPGNKLILITRTGKTHEISAHDPLLRRPNLWQRLVYARRFPEFSQTDGNVTPKAHQTPEEG